MNDYRAAESDFLAGVSLSPDPAALFWLGRTREKLGDLAGAADSYRKALALQPNMNDAKERLDALASGHPLPFLQNQQN
jgi:tetratricopeptide (TPR) repeat protein